MDFRHGGGPKKNIGAVMDKVKFVFFDLWKTLTTSHCREPVYSVQRALSVGVSHTVEGGAGDGFVPNDAFLRHCLTTNISDRRQFAEHAASKFGGRLDDESMAAINKVLDAESGCVAEFYDVRKTLDALKAAGIPLGIISNLWAFPVPYIFESAHGLGDFFPADHRVYSFLSGHRKPEPEIFLDGLERTGLKPEEVLMVGDNLQADCIGARSVGMQAALIDREGLYKQEELPMGIIHLPDLTSMLPLLNLAS